MVGRGHQRRRSSHLQLVIFPQSLVFSFAIHLLTPTQPPPCFIRLAHLTFLLITNDILWENKKRISLSVTQLVRLAAS